MVAGVLGAVLALTAPGLAGCTSSGTAGPAAQLQAHVGDGWLQGTMSQGVREFLGVPYAAPPTRFAPPQPARPWNGVRPATAHGPACIQFEPGGVLADTATSEDCLDLDIYTPAGARPVRNYQAPFYARAAVFTDSLEACPDYQGAATFAAQVPTWEEEFDDPASPTFMWGIPQGVNMSGTHSVELYFLWTSRA